MSYLTAKTLSNDDRGIGTERRIEIASGLVSLRKKGILDAVYIDNDRVRVRKKPDALLSLISWHSAARLVRDAERKGKE